MELPPALLQFMGSLFAIVALAALAWWLRLGPEPRLEGPEQARRAADEAISGFEPTAIALDLQGRGALLRDLQGRVLLLRPHGTHFVGRLLTSNTRVVEDGPALLIDTAERRFGTARLELEDADAWKRSIEAIKAT